MGACSMPLIALLFENEETSFALVWKRQPWAWLADRLLKTSSTQALREYDVIRVLFTQTVIIFVTIVWQTSKSPHGLRSSGSPPLATLYLVTIFALKSWFASSAVWSTASPGLSRYCSHAPRFNMLIGEKESVSAVKATFGHGVGPWF